MPAEPDDLWEGPSGDPDLWAELAERHGDLMAAEPAPAPSAQRALAESDPPPPAPRIRPPGRASPPSDRRGVIAYPWARAGGGEGEEQGTRSQA